MLFAYSSSGSSGDDVVHDFARRVRQTEVAPSISIGQFRVVDAQQIEHGRVQIVDVSFLLGGLVSKFIRISVSHAALDPAARKPYREAARIVIAAVDNAGGCLVRRLDRGCAAEFGAAYHKRVFEKAALL